jgi:hypothetical protein
VYYNPTVDHDYSEGKNLDSNKREEFPNQMEDSLVDELDQAKRLGVEPISPTDAAKFDKIIDEGPIKWVVDQDGELKIMEKFKDGEELKHTVLSNGNPVLAAGEAEIVGNSTDGYLILEFNNNSGHFIPSSGSLDIGKEKFIEAINISNDF